MKAIIKYLRPIFFMVMAFTFVTCDDDDVVIPTVKAGFTYTTSNGLVTFLNTSENASSYEWDFGDGTTSTENNPIKVYNNSGTYTVSLKSDNVAGATNTFQDDITIIIPESVSLPLNFDGTSVDYSSITTFDGATFQIVENPDLSGSNTVASNVGQIVTVGNPFQGIKIPYETPIDFSGTNKTITINYWSNAAIDVLVKFDQGVGGARAAEVLVSHTGSGWELLTFNFATSAVRSFIQGDATNGQPIVPDGQYGVLELLVGFNQSFAGTVYVDDFLQIESVIPADTQAPVITLNGDAVIDLTVGDTFTDPGVTANDNVDGDITGNVVVGGDTVDANTIGTYVITYNVSDAAGNPATEVTRTVNVAAASSMDSLIIDFENSLTGVTVGHFETGGSLITNPVSGGINTSANVYDLNWTSGNQWWGGVGFTFADGVLDDQATVYKAKLYATVAPINVLFEVEVDGTNAPVGQVQEITTANQWVEVTFTLANIPAGANRILVRPDIGDSSGTKPNSGNLYIDDIVCSSCTVGGGGGSGSTVFSEDFSTDTSGDWTRIADATNTSEASITYLASGGVTNGALQFSGINSVAGGKNYEFRLEKTGLTLTDSGSYQLKISMKRDGAIENSNVALNVQVINGSGPPTEGTINGIQDTVSDTEWTEYTIDVDNVVNPNGLVLVNVRIQPGAIVGAGGTIQIDDISFNEK